MTNNQQKQIQHQCRRKCRWTLMVCACLIFSLSLVKLVVSNRAATWGQELEAMELAAKNLQKENLVLRLQAEQRNGSLANMQETARAWGFVDKPQYLYLSPGSSVAQKLP